MLIIHVMAQPDLAVAIWPPAGIGLAGALLWGVRIFPALLLGELLIATYVHGFSGIYHQDVQIHLSLILMAGTLLRAYLGAFFVRQIIGQKPELIKLSEILLFYSMAAVVTIVLSTLFFISALSLAGFTQKQTLLTDYMAWFCGDALGVMIFTPLTLVLYGRTKWQWSNRLYSIIVPFLVIFLLVILLFNAIRIRENTRIEQLLVLQAHLIEKLVDGENLSNMEVSEKLQRVWPEISTMNMGIELIDNSTVPSQVLVKKTEEYPVDRIHQLFPMRSIENTLQIKIIPSAAYLEEQYEWSIWLMILAGLTFTGFFTTSILALTGRTALTETQVRRRTQQYDELNRALQEKNQTYLNMIENQPVIFWRVDMQLDQFTYVSKEAETILGYPISQWLSEKDFFFNHLHPDDLSYVQSVVEYLPEHNSKIEIEYRMIAHSGEVKWFRDVLNLSSVDLPSQECVGMMIDITDKKNTELKIRQLAYQDYLTGLPNRQHFYERFKIISTQATEKRTQGALLFLDMDRFKVLNDSLGHDYGDRLLIQVGRRLQKFKEDLALIARFGGDEFILLSTYDFKNPEDAQAEAIKIAHLIKSALSAEFAIDDHLHQCTVSIGISIFPQKGMSINDIIKQADAAMYRSKENGKDEITVFENSMRDDDDEKLRLEQSLRVAVQNNEFSMVYQPIFDTNEEVVCFESLIRWQIEDAFYLPDAFIPVAEETGLIHLIGNWTIDQVCAEIKKTGNSISVNLSSRQFHQPHIVEVIFNALERHLVPADQLILELTESVAVYDINETVSRMRVLKSKGVRIAIDDFGTGYSSLEYLHRMPIDFLKIDKSFIRNLDNDGDAKTIVKTIAAMANLLNLKVIAEGVETEEQFNILKEIQCPYFQGYLFARPSSSAIHN